MLEEESIIIDGEEYSEYWVKCYERSAPTTMIYLDGELEGS